LRGSTTSCRWTSILQLFKHSEDNSFHSGTSYMILMVTFSWLQRLHPRGLVPNLMGLRCQFRGGWSQRIPVLISESDSSRRGDAASFVFQSYYGHKSNLSESTSAWGATKDGSWFRGAYPLFFFTSGSLSITFRRRSPAYGYSEGRWPMANVGVHSCISTMACSTSSDLLYCAVL
jgi:hypothetical protein